MVWLSAFPTDIIVIMMKKNEMIKVCLYNQNKRANRQVDSLKGLQGHGSIIYRFSVTHFIALQLIWIALLLIY